MSNTLFLDLKHNSVNIATIYVKGPIISGFEQSGHSGMKGSKGRQILWQNIIFSYFKLDDSDIKVPFRFISLIDELTSLPGVRSLIICHVLHGSPLVSISLLL